LCENNKGGDDGVVRLYNALDGDLLHEVHLPTTTTTTTTTTTAAAHTQYKTHVSCSHMVVIFYSLNMINWEKFLLSNGIATVYLLLLLMLN
jgi:hypothetical protein